MERESVRLAVGAVEMVKNRAARALEMLDPKSKDCARLLQKIDILQLFLTEQDAEIERLQADLDVWHKMSLEIAEMVVEAGRDPG